MILKDKVIHQLYLGSLRVRDGEIRADLIQPAPMNYLGNPPRSRYAPMGSSINWR